MSLAEFFASGAADELDRLQSERRRAESIREMRRELAAARLRRDLSEMERVRLPLRRSGSVRGERLRMDLLHDEEDEEHELHEFLMSQVLGGMDLDEEDMGALDFRRRMRNSRLRHDRRRSRVPRRRPEKRKDAGFFMIRVLGTSGLGDDLAKAYRAGELYINITFDEQATKVCRNDQWRFHPDPLKDPTLAPAVRGAPCVGGKPPAKHDFVPWSAEVVITVHEYLGPLRAKVELFRNRGLRADELLGETSIRLSDARQMAQERISGLHAAGLPDTEDPTRLFDVLPPYRSHSDSLDIDAEFSLGLAPLSPRLPPSGRGFIADSDSDTDSDSPSSPVPASSLPPPLQRGDSGTVGHVLGDAEVVLDEHEDEGEFADPVRQFPLIFETFPQRSKVPSYKRLSNLVNAPRPTWSSPNAYNGKWLELRGGTAMKTLSKQRKQRHKLREGDNMHVPAILLDSYFVGMNHVYMTEAEMKEQREKIDAKRAAASDSTDSSSQGSRPSSRDRDSGSSFPFFRPSSNSPELPRHQLEFRSMPREANRAFPEVAGISYAGLTVHPMHIGAAVGSHRLFQCLLRSGGKYFAAAERDGTTLRMAALYGNPEALTKLLQVYDRDGLTIDAHGRTALHYAIFGACYHPRAVQVVRRFERYNKLIDVTDNGGFTPLALLCSLKAPSALSIAHFLVGQGADVNHRNKVGDTPLMVAIRANDPGLVHFFVDMSEACLQTHNNAGLSPLSLAVELGHFDIVDLLLMLGARQRPSPITGETPLHVAARTGHASIVPLLLYSIKEPMAKLEAARRVDLSGCSPIDLADMWYEQKLQTDAPPAEAEGHRQIAAYLRAKMIEWEVQARLDGEVVEVSVFAPSVSKKDEPSACSNPSDEDRQPDVIPHPYAPKLLTGQSDPLQWAFQPHLMHTDALYTYSDTDSSSSEEESDSDVSSSDDEAAQTKRAQAQQVSGMTPLEQFATAAHSAEEDEEGSVERAMRLHVALSRVTKHATHALMLEEDMVPLEAPDWRTHAELCLSEESFTRIAQWEHDSASVADFLSNDLVAEPPALGSSPDEKLYASLRLPDQLLEMRPPDSGLRQAEVLLLQDNNQGFGQRLGKNLPSDEDEPVESSSSDEDSDDEEPEDQRARPFFRAGAWLRKAWRKRKSRQDGKKQSGDQPKEKKKKKKKKKRFSLIKANGGIADADSWPDHSRAVWARFWFNLHGASIEAAARCSQRIAKQHNQEKDQYHQLKLRLFRDCLEAVIEGHLWMQHLYVLLFYSSATELVQLAAHLTRINLMIECADRAAADGEASATLPTLSARMLAQSLHNLLPPSLMLPSNKSTIVMEPVDFVRGIDGDGDDSDREAEHKDEYDEDDDDEDLPESTLSPLDEQAGQNASHALLPTYERLAQLLMVLHSLIVTPHGEKCTTRGELAIGASHVRSCCEQLAQLPLHRYLPPT